MSNLSDVPANRDSDRESESLLDKARRAGALSSYLTIAVLLWLLIDARSENRALREQFWKLRCPTPATAMTPPKALEPETSTALQLLEWVALRCPSANALQKDQGTPPGASDNGGRCSCRPVTKVSLAPAKQTSKQRNQ